MAGERITKTRLRQAAAEARTRAEELRAQIPVHPDEPIFSWPDAVSVPYLKRIRDSEIEEEIYLSLAKGVPLF